MNNDKGENKQERMTFNAGDVVVLASGSPRMTFVEEVYYTDKWTDSFFEARVAYYDPASTPSLVTTKVPTAALIRAPDEA
jgi:uncharacterized protein YodC (DUF2158 family)